MTIKGIAPQLRTRDMDSSISFYTEKLAFTVEFRYEDFYAGIRAGEQVFHLKSVCDKDPSIDYVDEGGHLHLYFETEDVAAFAERIKANGVAIAKDLHETPWQTRESSSTTIRATPSISASRCEDRLDHEKCYRRPARSELAGDVRI
jgi:catechol 2,3-dioxygenase-like lactoylglutathione lyase family enzyme